MGKFWGELTLDTNTWTNLELPLSWHNLSVGTGDLDIGVQAGLVVSINNVSAEDLSGTNTTVVWTLWTWETIYWPSVWAVSHVKKGVLLLKTKPWLVGSMCLHKLGSLMSVVELVWGSVIIPALGKNEDVWGAAHWVWVDANWADVDIGVVAWSLASGRTIKVPFWKVTKVLLGGPFLLVVWVLELNSLRRRAISHVNSLLGVSQSATP